MKKKYLIVGLLIIVEVLSIFLLYKNNTVFDLKELDNVSITSEKNKMLAMYVGIGDTYEEYEGETFPKGYTLNTTKSKCVDINGQEVPGAISTDETGNIKLTSNKTLYCYIYLDIKGKQCSYSGELTQGTEYTDGTYTYRYKQQGTYSDWKNIEEDGWGVMLTNKESTAPVTEAPCVTISNKPVVSTAYMFAKSKATSIDLSDYNTSLINNMSNMFYHADATTIIGYENFDLSNVKNLSVMFGDTKISKIDVSKWDLSNVTDISEIFDNSAATEIIGYEDWNTSNVKNMYSAFEATKIPTIDISDWDTSNATALSYMFYASKANVINVTGLNLSKVTSLQMMFSSAQATQILGYEDWDTSNITNMYATFASVKIPILDLSKWNTKNVTDMSWMFSEVKTTEIKGYKDFDTSNVNAMAGMFRSTALQTIDISKYNLSKLTNIDSIFSDAAATEIIGYENLDTSNITMMSGVFKNSNLNTINVSKWTTPKVKFMNSMFNGAKATKIIGYENFDTTNVLYMQEMFKNTNISTIDVSNYKTQNVTDMGGMFDGAKATQILGYQNFNTEKVKEMDSMFANTNINTIDVSKYQTPVLTNMSYMFDNAKATTITGLNNLNTSSVTNMSYMFRNTLVPTLDLSNWDTTAVTSTTDMFKGAKATTGYARTSTDANKFNSSSNKPTGLTFRTK